MLEPLCAVFGAILPLAAAGAVGFRFFSQTNVPGLVKLAAGAAVLHLAIFALMLVHAARPVIVVGVCIACIALALRESRRSSKTTPRLLSKLPRPPLIVAAVLTVYCGFYLVHALAPELETDALSYHLQPSLDARKTGGFPEQIDFYNRLPHAVELLYVPAHFVGESRATRMVHLSLLVATLPLIVLLAVRLGLSHGVGWTAAALYFCAPVVGASGTTSLVDAALVFFCVAGVSAAIAYWSSPTLAGAALSGVLAGMCYATKMSGGIAIPTALIILMARRVRPLHTALAFSTGVALVTAPWIVRNVVETGNPFAPFLNSWFPNDFFYASTEKRLAEAMRSYGVPFHRRPLELTVGPYLQGIVGPVFLLTPLALMAIWKRPVQILLCLAVILTAPWWLNAGARFFMPALPFLALALAAAIPSRAGLALVLVHAVLSWPAVVAVLHSENWRIRGFPWRAALGLVSTEGYLQDVSWDYRLAKLIEGKTEPDARILDVYGVQRAFLDRRVSGTWQTKDAQLAIAAMELMRVNSRFRLYSARASFPEQDVASITIRPTSDSGAWWSINSVALENNTADVLPTREWTLEPSVYPSDAPLVLDRNLISRWSTWEDSRRADFFTIRFGAPLRLSAARVIAPASEHESGFSITLQSPNGSSHELQTLKGPVADLRLREHAREYLKTLGFKYLVVSTMDNALGSLGKSLVEERTSWGVETVASQDWVTLLRIP